MSVKDIASSIEGTLKGNGILASVSVKGGTWTEPAHLEVKAAGKRIVLPFWADVPDAEPGIAQALIDDVYRAIGRTDLVEIRQ